MLTHRIYIYIYSRSTQIFSGEYLKYIRLKEKLEKTIQKEGELPCAFPSAATLLSPSSIPNNNNKQKDK